MSATRILAREAPGTPGGGDHAPCAFTGSAGLEAWAQTPAARAAEAAFDAAQVYAGPPGHESVRLRAVDGGWHRQVKADRTVWATRLTGWTLWDRIFAGALTGEVMEVRIGRGPRSVPYRRLWQADGRGGWVALAQLIEDPPRRLECWTTKHAPPLSPGWWDWYRAHETPPR